MPQSPLLPLRSNLGCLLSAPRCHNAGVDVAVGAVEAALASEEPATQSERTAPEHLSVRFTRGPIRLKPGVGRRAQPYAKRALVSGTVGAVAVCMEFNYEFPVQSIHQFPISTILIGSWRACPQWCCAACAQGLCAYFYIFNVKTGIARWNARRPSGNQ